MNFEIGKTYANYEIIDVLSSSRDGVTYKVKNTLVNRLEAMKVLAGNAQNDLESVERFLREVRVHASMQHPNIVAFYNATELDRRLVMTSELAEGVTLAARLELGPLPCHDAVSCMTQVLAALAYAHERNVVHRDLTPARIILTPEGVARLNGFSLAKGVAEAHLTVVGAVVGSLKYISPEQVKGSEKLDARCDIYSAGVVLYEALAGKPPFDAKSQFELMAAHVNTFAPPPSALQPLVPKELDAIVLKAMAKDPAERFQTAAEFREALSTVNTAAAPAPQPAEVSTAAAVIVPGPESEPASAAPPVASAEPPVSQPEPPPQAMQPDPPPPTAPAPVLAEPPASQPEPPPPAIQPEPPPPPAPAPVSAEPPSAQPEPQVTPEPPAPAAPPVISAEPPVSPPTVVPVSAPLSAPVFVPPSAPPLPRELMLAGFFLFVVGVAAFFAFR